ncbi:MAG: hypothetical protein JWO30_4472 [Fibrobacteres bacterium]|nr:hypothetical protein [Fibrobacterota bacterium]
MLAAMDRAHAQPGAQTVDFQDPAYVAGKSILAVDGWTKMYKADPDPAASFQIQSDTANAANKWAHCQNSLATSAYRDFPEAGSAESGAFLDLRWRWRASTDLAHMCFGTSRVSTVEGFYPLALICFEPSGAMTAKGSRATLLTGETWLKQKWYYMRMMMDVSKNTFTVYMAVDSTRKDERLIAAAAPLNDVAERISRFVIRSQQGTGFVDVDDIYWTPLSSLQGNNPPDVLSNPRDTAVNVGGTAVFRVSVSRTATAFQWTRNGIDVSDATDSKLNVPGVRRADSGAVYGCKITGIGGNLVTATAKLEVKFPAPTVTPEPQDIKDSLPIHISSPVPAAKIFYSLNGAAFQELKNALILYPPASVKAFAVLNADTSISATWNFPKAAAENVETPVATPSGGNFADSIRVSLTTGSAGASIYYTLDGSVPDPSIAGQRYIGSFRLNSDATLKAVAVTGSGSSLRKSPVLTEKYVFMTPGRFTLVAGVRLDISGGYTLFTADGAPDVLVDLSGSNIVSGAQGFRDIQFAIRIFLKDNAASFPVVEFSAPAGERRAFYGLDSAGNVKYITSDGKAKISNPGIYFLAIDTLPPQITRLTESIVSGDSTRTQFLIEDNISNPTVDLMRSDDARLGYTGKAIGSGETLMVVMKNDGDRVRPLTIRLLASDHRSITSYPPAAAFPRFLAQKTSASTRTPDRFRFHVRARNPWDLLSLPLPVDPPITLAALQSQNPEANLEAAVWDRSKGKYRYLESQEAFEPGASIWVAATAAESTSLVLPSLQTVPQPEDDSWKMVLHKGWNQIASPVLATLYWPISKAATVNFDQSSVKSPHAYDPETEAYGVSDSLEPWRGYFVENKNGDTTVTLLLHPPAALSAPKVSASGTISIDLKLRYVSLHLGASARAKDGIGIEDEQSPPAMSEDGLRLSSARQSGGLETDIVGWQPGVLCRWRVVASIPVAAGAESGAGSPVDARVESMALPGGYSAWAVSRSRGIRMRLDQAGGFPVYPGFADTLDIVAGPAAMVESGLAAVPSSIAAFDVSLSPVPGGFNVLLRLPSSYRIAWRLFSTEGRSRDAGTLALPGGVYHLDPMRKSSGYPPGIYFLRFEWSATDRYLANRESSELSGRWTRKILIR